MPKGIFLQLEVDFAGSDGPAKLLRYGRDVRPLRDLLVQMWCYCKRHRSDGHIPFEQVGLLVFPDTPKNGLRDADRLCDVGIAEKTDTGYFLPGFLKRNPSADAIAEESARKAEVGRLGGKRSGQVRRNKANAKQGASTETNTDTETYTDTDSETGSLEVGGDRNDTIGSRRATDPTHCTDHQSIDNPGPCGGCKRAREAWERSQAAALAALGPNCKRCGGHNWIETVDGKPGRKCNHLDIA